MPIVVTGATGGLGSLVVQYLLKKVPPQEIAVCVRSPEKAAPLAERGIEVRYGDYEDLESLRRSFMGASKLLVISHPGRDHTVRIRLHATVIEAAKKAGVDHIVYTSHAYAEKSVYALARVHQATEQMLRTTDIPFTVLRNSLYRHLFVNETLKTAIEGGKLLTSTGTGKLNSATRDNLALAAATVLSEQGHENQTYELTSAEPWDFDEVARLLSEISGKRVVHRSTTEDEVRAYLTRAGMEERPISVLLLEYQAIAHGRLAETSPALRRLIGSALTSLRESVEQVVQLSQ